MAGALEPVGKVVGSLLGMQTEAPRVEPPAPMPSPEKDEATLAAARRRRVAQEQAISGATLLSGGTRETLG
jgi:hypothetical protein